MFRLATMEDVDQIEKVFIEAKRNMANDGLEQWNEEDGIPNRETAIEGINSNTMYVYTVEQVIAGVIVINDDFYQSYPITPDPLRARALHRVAVATEFLGRGIGQQLYIEAEQTIKAMGYSTIIVDTYSKNVKMLNLIVKCGFEPCGEFTLYEHLPNWLMYQKQI